MTIGELTHKILDLLRKGHGMEEIFVAADPGRVGIAGVVRDSDDGTFEILLEE